ncbi:MAG: IS110 family transposase [Anaerolineales bacterium]
MKFYTKTHKHYCGIDLHTKWMYICILNQEGDVVYHRNHRADREEFIKAISPYRKDLVVAVECMFTWYWIADLCDDEGIDFVLGHALYMRAIHGGKAKNDKIDSHKIAALLKGGLIPMSYVYPKQMRATRDLMRRRNHFVRKRAELLAHIQNTSSQYNLPPLGRIAKKGGRDGLVELFPVGSAQKNVELDLALIESYDPLLNELERYIVKTANGHDPVALALLKTVHGIGKVLSLVILYEIESIERFSRVQELVSYARLVKCARESNGKKSGYSGKKIGNAHLKWAFSEAAVLFLKGNEPAQIYREKLANKHGKGKSLTILAHKLARAVYYMLKNKVAFDQEKFLRTG